MFVYNRSINSLNIRLAATLVKCSGMVSSLRFLNFSDMVLNKTIAVYESKVESRLVKLFSVFSIFIPLC